MKLLKREKSLTFFDLPKKKQHKLLQKAAEGANNLQGELDRAFILSSKTKRT